METCETLKDVGQGGRRRWAVMSHSKAAAASPGPGAGGGVGGGGEGAGQIRPKLVSLCLCRDQS